MDEDITATDLARASSALPGSDELIGLAQASKALGTSPQTLWRLVERLKLPHERLPAGEGHVTALPAHALEVLRPLVSAPTPATPFERAGTRDAHGHPEGRIARQNRARAYADRLQLQSRLAALEDEASAAQADATTASPDASASAPLSEDTEVELTRLQNALRRERAERARLEEDVQRQQHELFEHEAAREQLERETARVQSERAAQETDQTPLTAEARLRELEDELAAAHERGDQLERKVAELEEERLARRPILRSLSRIDKHSA